MNLADLSVVKGWPDTVDTLERWMRRPVRTIVPWVLVSALVAAALLGLTWLVARASPPDPARPGSLPTSIRDHPGYYAALYIRSNLVVLALHAMACLGSYVTNTALTDPADGDNELLGTITHRVGLVAVVFVPFATLFSIGTQSWILGSRASTLAEHLRLPLDVFLVTVVPHAMIELTAVFLPLAAWLVLSRRDRWNELLAATIVSTSIAVPLIVAAAVVEATTWPARIEAAQAAHPDLEGTYIGGLAATANPREFRRKHVDLAAGPLIGGPFESRAEAIAVARRETRTGPAAVIFDSPAGLVVQELASQEHDPAMGEPPRPRPTTLDVIEGKRIGALDAAGARRLGVVAFVEGRKVVELDEVVWDEVTDTDPGGGDLVVV